MVQTYFAYPLSLQAWSQFRRNRGYSKADYEPSVALIVLVYNQEDVIPDKIENSLQLSYPERKLNIVVFSDASDDRTDTVG